METVNIQLTDKAARDYRLVCLARENGDEKAFADLLKIYREPLYLMLLKMTNDPVEADDLTIEAFGKAFR
jgi:RNA polymerase sigma-70 factor (ECF subfamily)